MGSSVTRERDQELIARAISGDGEAFSDLVTNRSPGVLAYLRRLLGNPEDARDIAQLTFIRVWENLHRYDPAYAFSTWVFRIAGNLAVDALRSRKSRSRTREEHLRLVVNNEKAVEPDGPRALAKDEARRVFEACAGALSEKQRLVFVLREFEERETKEIAEILECRESTVRNHLFQARQVLREELRRRFPEYVRGREARHD